MDNFIRTSGSNGVILQVYKENYSLASAWEGKDGKTNLRWAKNQKGRDEYDEKATPVKVILGDRPTAVSVLRTLLSELGEPGQTYVPGIDDYSEPPPF